MEDRVLRRRWWGTESKAFFKSKKTAQEDESESKEANQD